MIKELLEGLQWGRIFPKKTVEIIEEAIIREEIMDDVYKKIENGWMDQWKERREAMKAMREEEKEFAYECRIRFLSEKFEEAKKEFYKHGEEIRDNLSEVNIKQAVKLQNKMNVYRDAIAGKGITQDMIENAREYSIGRIIPVNKQGFALCIWHDETNPSMYTKKNYAYCFSCNKSDSAIGVYMAVNNVSFKQAVIDMQ